MFGLSSKRKSRRRAARPALGALATIVVGFVLGAALSPVLFGCVPEESSLWRAVENIRGHSYALPEASEDQLQRFDMVFRTYSSDPTNTREIKHFRDAFTRVHNDYLRPVDDKVLVDAAIKGVEELKGEPGSFAAGEVVEAGLDSMMAALDPHSTYLNAEELKETFISTSGKFGGLGIEVTMQDGFVRVVSPIEGTPASRAGLQPGDLITHLDGESIEGITIMDAVKQMRGEPGTDIRLTIRREGRSPFDVAVTRAVITVQAVRWHREGDIGYIRLASFTEQADEGLNKALSELHEQEGTGLKGIVLDLRNNPGGLLDQALAVADTFLQQGRIVSVRGRNPAHAQAFDAQPGDLADGLPVVVLINSGSASASEIVASALQEDHRAVVMGRSSFGKGSVQTITPLPVQGALKLTTALYYTPGGHAIQARGVIPDIAIKGEVNEETTVPPRESDLPGALAASETAPKPRLGSIEEARCPAAGEEGKDKLLGCALSFLHAGSPDRFLASMSDSRM